MICNCFVGCFFLNHAATDFFESDTGNKWQASNVGKEIKVTITQYEEESGQVEGDFVDFSHLFDAVLGKRAESGQKKFEGNLYIQSSGIYLLKMKNS